MKQARQYPYVLVTPKGERSILYGHPWIYDQEVMLPKGGETRPAVDGDLADVFSVKGGREAGEKFLENLELCSIVVHVGDIHTSVLHPASTTHRQLSEEAQLAAGIDPGLIRLSVGLETAEDIIADLSQALDKVR